MGGWWQQNIQLFIIANLTFLFIKVRTKGWIITFCATSQSPRATVAIMGVARIFQRRGGESHWVIQRGLTRLSPEYCRLFAYKKAFKGGGVTCTPGPPLAMPLVAIEWKCSFACQTANVISTGTRGWFKLIIIIKQISLSFIVPWHFSKT